MKDGISLFVVGVIFLLIDGGLAWVLLNYMDRVPGGKVGAYILAFIVLMIQGWIIVTLGKSYGTVKQGVNEVVKPVEKTFHYRLALLAKRLTPHPPPIVILPA